MIYVPCMYIFGYTITLSTYIVNIYIYMWCVSIASYTALYPLIAKTVSCRILSNVKMTQAEVSINFCEKYMQVSSQDLQRAERANKAWICVEPSLIHFGVFWCFNCFSFKNIFTQHLPSKIWMRSEWHLNDILDNLRVFSDSFQTEKDRGAG